MKIKQIRDLVKTNILNYTKSDKWDFINYLDTGNLINNKILDIQRLNFDVDVIPSRAKRKAKKGDILYSTVRPNQRHFGYLTSDIENLLVSTGFAVLTPKNKETNFKFLYYFLTQNNIVDYLHSIAEGSVSTYPSIQTKDIEKIYINLPKLEFQNKIASILSAYDDLIEVNNKKIKTLNEMAQEIYKEWFVRFRFSGHEKVEFQNGIPKDWEVVKVSKVIVRLPFGKTYKQYELENDGKVIVIDQGRSDFLGFHNNNPDHIATPENPIILFGDHNCKFALMTQNFSLGENIIPLKTKEYNTYFIYFAIKDLVVTTEYKRHFSMLCSRKILLPKKYLQDNFENFIRPLKCKIDILRKSNLKLITQRDLLLPRLMSGKLEVKG